MATSAMFEGLVFDETGEPAGLGHVGANACYIVDDDGFKRHIDAETVDRQVLRFMREQVEGQRDVAVSTMMEMMGKDDLFTKAALETNINNMEEHVGQPLPEQARQWMGMLGFRIVIDERGQVVDIEMPAGEVDDGEY